MIAIALFLLFLLHAVVKTFVVVMDLHSVNYFMKRTVFLEGEI